MKTSTIFKFIITPLLCLLMTEAFANRTFSDIVFHPADGRTIYFESASHCHLICRFYGVNFTKNDQHAYLTVDANDVRDFSVSQEPEVPPYYQLSINQGLSLEIFAEGDRDRRESSGIGFTVPEGKDGISVHAHCEVVPGDICPDIELHH